MKSRLEAVRRIWLGAYANRGLLLCFLLTTVTHPWQLFAQDEQNISVDEFEFLIRKSLSAREEVRSGYAVITGTKVASDEKGRLTQGDVSGVYLFDRPSQSFRFEWVEPCNVVIGKPGERTLPTSGMDGELSMVKFKCCRTPNYYADWSQVSAGTLSGLNIRSIESDSREKIPYCGRRPFDPLSSGMMGYFEFSKGTPLSQVYQEMLSKSVSSISNDGDIVTVEVKDNNASHTLVVDETNMTPMQLHSKSLGDPSEFKSTARWKEIVGVTVPSSLTVELDVPNIARDRTELHFEWSRVNEDFLPSEFEYTAFENMPVGVVDVFDNRGDNVEHLGVWESKDVIAIAKPEIDREPLQDRIKPVNGRYSVILIINIVIAVLILVLYLYRRSKKQRK